MVVFLKNFIGGHSALLALALLGACSQSEMPESKAVATAPTETDLVLSAAGFKPEAGEASPEGRLLIGRGKDYMPIQADPDELFHRLEGSMQQRRVTAWKIVEAMLAPEKLTVGTQSYDVPLWHTWFEGMSENPEVDQKVKLFITELASCKSATNCTKSREQIAKEVVASNDKKNLVRSLRSANITQTLGQFRSNPHDTLGKGFTLFSPSFMEHMLSQAQGVDECSQKVPPDQAPPSETQFSPCIKEFPRSAVMVKASWVPLDGSNPKVGYTNTDATAMTRVMSTGSWPGAVAASVNPRTIYTIETVEREQFGLVGLHFSTKDTREWVWISLWWSPDPNTDYGQDRPASLASLNNGVWANYKMCVTTAFNEGDPAPWAAFEKTQTSLAAALRAAHVASGAQKQPAPHDMVTSWCSNPNIESQSGNGRTNCIGCHQYSNTWNVAANRLARFGDTYSGDPNNYPQFGRARRRQNFPAEFAWSFGNEFSNSIRDAKKDQGFEW